MAYDPEKQYRCTIIRGRSKNEMDDLLPIYASIIQDVCPCEKNVFVKDFNAKLSRFISSPTKKTLDNHRTEITGKLFGMWYLDDLDIVRSSKRTDSLIKNRDQPSFFKEISWNFQFPNGMDKLQTIKDRISHKIQVRPCAFVLKFILELSKVGDAPTKNEVAYYVLNNLDVLQGNSDVTQVVNEVIKRRKSGKIYKVKYDDKESSYSMQHISELINILELANLIKQEKRKTDTLLELNEKENEFIIELTNCWNKKPIFDMYNFDLDNTIDIKKMYKKWDVTYSECSVNEDLLRTKTYNLIGFDVKEGKVPHIEKSTLDIGDEGEMMVFDYEKNRVEKFLPRLVNKVIYFGKQKGLGYDIQSIIAENPNPEHAIYIEVKSTVRVTAPTKPFRDNFDLTRNEWIAAEQHKDKFFVYRVYLTNDGAHLYKMQDLLTMSANNEIYAEPLKYHVEFESKKDEEKWLKI